jgi:hypothetical protein
VILKKKYKMEISQDLIKYLKLQKLAEKAKILKQQLAKSKVDVLSDYEYEELREFYHQATPELILELLQTIYDISIEKTK